MSLYSYTYDNETGGLLLNSSPTDYSKEPRPVYAAELDLFGFDKYWNYEKQSDVPYMWAESNRYWYRGKLVAILQGGDVYSAPKINIPHDKNGNKIEPELEGVKLRPVDIEAMIEANRDILEIIEQTTVKRILEVYEKYKNRLDLFHVAYSGGKDSSVLLDLVKKALPKGSFVVVFGDTGMEFPDTYELIENIEKECKDENISFYTASSHLTPEESWRVLGPPSRTLRWCCSVHKSAPQTLKLREITGKSDYTGLAFVGVRAHESSTRSKYEYENYGKKQKGQYSHNSILEWTSAEIWLYIYSNNLFINEAYKKGSSRVGCICCPMGGGKASFVEHKNYKSETISYHTAIKRSNGRPEIPDDDYIVKGGWNARLNGLYLTNNEQKYSETIKNGRLNIKISSPLTDWKEWIKVLGDIVQDGDNYTLFFNDLIIYFSCKYSSIGNGYTIEIEEHIINKLPSFGKLFKYTFRKSAYCTQCKTCVAICKHNAITFDKEKLRVEGCKHCYDCYSVAKGCLAYQSLNIPSTEGGKMKSLNTFSNHAPKEEWLHDFFLRKTDFLRNNSLGSVQKPFFKRFLRDSALIEGNETTPFTDICKKLNWNSDTSLGLIYLNLVSNNPQIAWYVRNMEIDNIYKRNEIKDLLIITGQTKNNVSSIINAFGRLTNNSFGKILRFGYVTEDGDLSRTKSRISDSRVVLYGLFIFAEKCNNYKQFNLSTLMNNGIERDGISPSRIFGLSNDEMKSYLTGLSAKYPDFIIASFTHDLEKITLAEDKSSNDVLDLFKEGNYNE